MHTIYLVGNQHKNDSEEIIKIIKMMRQSGSM